MKMFLSILIFSFTTQGFAKTPQQQADYALNYLLENLSHPQVLAGAVIASPSQKNPNYFYHWVRDAALTMKVFVKLLPSKSRVQTNEAQRILTQWLEFEKHTQTLNNPTGHLGEPRFNVDGTADFSPWGRPQNDGPALRAVTMISWALTLLKMDQIDFVLNNLYCQSGDCPINKDLQHVIEHWKEPSVDLWEEVKGDHFFTRVAQYKALQLGIELTQRLGDVAMYGRLSQTKPSLQSALQSHWDASRGLIRPTLHQVDGWTHKTSNLDVAVILAALVAGVEEKAWGPLSNQVLATAEKLSGAFLNLYPLNKNTTFPAIAIGRYPEDVYDGNGFSGGHPWFIATNAFAELYCLHGEKNLGREYLKRSVLHSANDGHMSEQFASTNGYMHGARDLTWSYASYLTAYFACY